MAKHTEFIGLDEIHALAYADAQQQCDSNLMEFDDPAREDSATAADLESMASTPHDGWDGWLLNGIGFTSALQEFGLEGGQEESEVFRRALKSYHEGAVDGASDWLENKLAELAADTV